MIHNERQYEITGNVVKRFKQTLKNEISNNVDPILFEASKRAMREKISELEQEMAEYVDSN